jgi:hypothetical protein
VPFARANQRQPRLFQETRTIRLDALKLRAEDHGCDACGTLRDSFMAVMFYILPAKLKRKRHKEREHSAIYCLDCYGRTETLPLLVNGKQLDVVKVPVEEREADLRCSFCAMPFSHRTIYALVTAGKWIGSDPGKHDLLALFCESCVESRKISLARKISGG